MAGALPGPVLLDEAMVTTLRRGSDEARPEHVSHVSSASARARSHVAPSHAPEKISRAGMQEPERTVTTVSVADLLAPPGVPDVREPGGLAAMQSNGAAMEPRSTIDAAEQAVPTIAQSAGAREGTAAAKTTAGPAHVAAAADSAWQTSGAVEVAPKGAAGTAQPAAQSAGDRGPASGAGASEAPAASGAGSAHSTAGITADAARRGAAAVSASQSCSAAEETQKCATGAARPAARGTEAAADAKAAAAANAERASSGAAEEVLKGASGTASPSQAISDSEIEEDADSAEMPGAAAAVTARAAPDAPVSADSEAGSGVKRKRGKRGGLRSAGKSLYYASSGFGISASRDAAQQAWGNPSCYSGEADSSVTAAVRALRDIQTDTAQSGRE